ncbi:MAG: response regulator [Bacteroidales bacterium]
MIKKLPFEYRITLIYVFVGLIWIFFSDILLERLISNPNMLSIFQSVKGSFYVLATAILLFFLVRNNMRKERNNKKKLQESELRYRSVFHDSKSVMLLINSMTGQIVDTNKAATEFYGYSFGKLTQMTIDNIQVQNQDKHGEVLFSQMNENQNFFKTQHRLKSGEVRNVEVYKGTLIIQGQTMIFAIVHDITRQMHMEKELVKAKEKAEESNRLKSAFLANLSHEIRTPMNGIIGFTELLKEDELAPGDKNRYVDIIHSSGEYLMRIISDIVEMSKLNTNQVQIFEETFDLVSLCQDVTNKINEENDKGIFIQTDIELSENKELWLVLDKVKLQQILYHLLHNALKNTKEGSIKAGCQITESKNLLFYVRDTGRGIDPRDHNIIFEPFRQAEVEAGAIQEGSGLGLSIVKAYIELMNGEIWLESTPGVGSVFYFTIPYKSEKRPSSGENLYAGSSMQKKASKILVAEDDEVSFAYIKEVLKMNNIEVVHAWNGKEAVDIIKNNKQGFDLILMDIKMPVMDGYEALRYIKNEDPNNKVVAQTAYALKNEKKTILEAGFDGYLAKPIQKEKLLQYIQ